MAKKKEERKTPDSPDEQNAAERENAKAEDGAAKEPAEPTPIEKAEALAEDYKRKWYSVSAEYDNYRKRNAAAVSKAYADGAAEAVLKILPVADNFGYAYDSAEGEKTRAGIEKVIKSFKTVLSSLGIEEIEIAVGAPFDESVMEAILSQPRADGESPNSVKQVLKKGYKQGDKVIRFAQVIVTAE